MRRPVVVTLVLKLVLVCVLAFFWWSHPFAHFTPPWSNLISSLLGFLLFVFGLNFIISILLLGYRLRKGMRLNSQDNLTTGVQNIYVLVIAMGVISFLLQLWGIDTRTLFTSLSIVAAAIAIVSKEFVTPILAGFVLVMSKELNIGDYVKIGDRKGKVVNMTLTKLTLLSEDEELVFLPNDRAYQSEIINYTQGDIRRVSISFELDVKFEGTVEDLEQNLRKQFDVYQDDIIPDSFSLRIVEIMKDAILFKFQYTLRERNRELEKTIRRKTARHVLNYVKTRNELARANGGQ